MIISQYDYVVFLTTEAPRTTSHRFTLFRAHIGCAKVKQ